MRTRTEAFYAPPRRSVGGPRYAIWHSPVEQPAKAVVVYVPPLGEEMNKARRMASLHARALAASGLAVMQADLLGCGDSHGEFEEASWEIWRSDVRDACESAMRRHAESWPSAPPPPLWLWGLRAGCLLAASAATSFPEPCHFLFWQPQGSGKQALQQFLRLRIAAEMGGATRGLGERLRRDLANGASVDVAGYRLPSSLALGLEQAKLDPPQRRDGRSRSLWFEIRPEGDVGWLPATEALQARWRSGGWWVGGESVPGPAFWATVEIEEAPALIDASVRAIVEMHTT